MRGVVVREVQPPVFTTHEIIKPVMQASVMAFARGARVETIVQARHLPLARAGSGLELLASHPNGNFAIRSSFASAA